MDVDTKTVTADELHRNRINACVEAAISAGMNDFQRILEHCEGADPTLVAGCIEKVKREKTLPPTTHAASCEEIFVRLPAPDPFRAQWWFTGESVELLSNRAATLSPCGKVVCVGAPTIGASLLNMERETSVLDVDEQVVFAVNLSTKKNAASTYDVADALPKNIRATFDVAVIDPPWYEPTMHAFIARALDALKDVVNCFARCPRA